MWYFAYGTSTSPERFTREYGPVGGLKPGTIPDHELTFANHDPEWGGGTSCIVPSSGGRVFGTVYSITPTQQVHLIDKGHGYGWQTKRAVVDGEGIEVGVLLPREVGPFAVPSDAYVAQIREGLSYLYPMQEIDPYLRTALRRESVFAGMIGQWADDVVPNREYGIEFRRLYPWKGMLRAPWGAAWGTLRSGEQSELYVHDEEETVMVLAGEGELRVDRNVRRVRKGDVVYFQPDCEHVLTNNSAGELEVLFIWWGGRDGSLWAGRKV